MGLVVQMRGKGAGKVLRFEDTQELVVFGRDPGKCQVVFAENVTVVGREHCALRRVLGRYRLVLNGDNRVLIDGQPAMDDQELPEECEIQLGPKGPKMRVRRLESGDLPATLDQGHQKGQATMIAEAHTSSRRNRILMLLAIAAVAVGAILGVNALRETDEDLGKAQKDIDKAKVDIEKARNEVAWTRDTVEVLTGKVGDLEGGLGDVAGMREAVDSMTNKLARVEKDVEQLGPRLKAGLTKAKPSVYLTLYRTADGIEQGGGTAWVVGPGLLATNSHVAETFGMLNPGVEMLVRSPAGEPKTFKVKEVRMHPGYEAFTHLWGAYKPVEGNSVKNSIPVDAAGAACDVALLVVDDPDGDLAPPLEIAGDAAVRSLAAGDVIGFVGYPMENMALTGTPVKRPSPQIQTGHITAVTNYFGAHSVRASESENHLIQHSCPAGGGASGSPVLNADGKVVAILSGGNVVIVPTVEYTPARVSSGVDINFAQRVDLLSELMEGRADSVQPERTRRWSDVIDDLFASGFLLERDQTVDGTMSDLALSLQEQSGHRMEYVWTPSDEKDGKANGRGAVSFDLPSGGTYLLMTLADREEEISMRAVVSPRGDASWDLRDDSVTPYLRYAMFTVGGVAEVRASASGADENVPVTYKLFRAREQPLTTETLRQQFLAAWLNHLVMAKGIEFDVELAVSGDVALGPDKVWEGHTDELPPGDYLATVISTSKKDVDVSVAKREGGEVLGEDRRDDYFPTVLFTLDAAGVIDFSIVGAEPGLAVEVRVFRAVLQ